jgi:hypothetical protein
MDTAFRIFVGVFILGMCNLFFEIDTLLFLKSTNGIITKADIKETTSKVSRSSQHITYLAPDINFEYEVNTKKYIGTSIFFPKMTNSGRTDESNMIHKNALVKVWYDTRNPSDAWLFFSPFAIFFTAIALLFGLAFLLNEMLIIRKKWRQMH